MNKSKSKRFERASIKRFLDWESSSNVMNLFLRVGNKNNLCIRVTQENLIEISLQTNLSYILLLMVYAYYYTLYSKWPCCHMQVHLSGNNVPMVKLPLNHISPPSMAAIFLTTHLIAVLQLSRYSIFYGRNTPIQLGLPWWSYSC